MKSSSSGGLWDWSKVASLVGGMLMAYLGGLHFWWPKITGRLYPEGWAKLAALIVFVVPAPTRCDPFLEEDVVAHPAHPALTNARNVTAVR